MPAPPEDHEGDRGAARRRRVRIGRVGRCSARRRSQRGSALVLVPAAVLVLLILASIAIDSALVFLAQRRLAGACLDAANDAVSQALDQAALFGREGATVFVDQAAAQEIGTDAARRVVDDRIVKEASCTATVGPDTAVRMRGQATVRLLFAPAVPGHDPSQTVHADEIAEINQRG